jgi:hypothetical protein
MAWLMDNWIRFTVIFDKAQQFFKKDLASKKTVIEKLSRKPVDLKFCVRMYFDDIYNQLHSSVEKILNINTMGIIKISSSDLHKVSKYFPKL